MNEFQRPWSYRLPPHSPAPLYLFFYKTFSFFLAAGLIAAFKKRKSMSGFWPCFFFALSASAVRNIPLFVLACAPLAAACWSNQLGPFFQKFPIPPLYRSMAAFALALFLLGFSARVITNAHSVSSHLSDRFGFGLDQQAQPVQACGFLVENKLDGKILNDLDDGDWLDWQGPQKTFIDGRLDVMGADFFTEYSKSQLPGGAAALAARYQPEFFLQPASNTPMGDGPPPDGRLAFGLPEIQSRRFI